MTRSNDETNRSIAEAAAPDAPLGQRLAMHSERLRAQKPDSAEAYDRLVGHLTAGNAGANAPTAGEAMPPFFMPDQSGRLISLAALTKTRPLVVSFNRGHWCRYCQLELRHLAELHGEVARLGADIVSIMPDRREFANRLKTQHDFPFDILTDVDNAYALSLGLMVWIGSEVHDLYDRIGVDLAEFQGNDGWFLPLPATFVVGTDGLIRSRFVNADYRERMTAEDILSALQPAGVAE